MQNYEKKVYRESVEEVAQEVLNKINNVQDVKVDLENLENGDYKAKVSVHLKGKSVVASKVGHSINESLSRSKRAVYRQLEKYKNRRKKFFHRSLQSAAI